MNFVQGYALHDFKLLGNIIYFHLQVCKEMGLPGPISVLAGGGRKHSESGGRDTSQQQCHHAILLT